MILATFVFDANTYTSHQYSPTVRRAIQNRTPHTSCNTTLSRTTFWTSKQRMFRVAHVIADLLVRHPEHPSVHRRMAEQGQRCVQSELGVGRPKGECAVHELVAGEGEDACVRDTECAGMCGACDYMMCV
jgi:hypothetical protein